MSARDKLTRDRARRLRRDSTRPERVLWSRLRSGRFGGVKFRRQHAIGPFIVDFYCAVAKLAVELDGRSHDGRLDYDGRREKFLRDRGVDVVRIHNDDVLKRLDAVLEMLEAAVQQRT